MSDSLSQEIRLLIAEITELEPESIEGDSHLVMDLGADSMAALELMAALEKRYAIVIDPECLPEMHSLGSITALVERVRGADPGS